MRIFSCLCLLIIVSSASLSNNADCRNIFSWPFNSTSIWNTPVGGAAVFTDANLFPNATPPHYGVYIDEDYFYTTLADDALVEWRDQGHWNATPDCEIFPWARVRQVPWPSNVTITQGGNNALALLMPDNDTLVLTQPAYKCSEAAPLLSLFDNRFPNTSIRGAGNWGGHGGSALNAIGGTLRLGELLPSSLTPPQHVLKLQLWAKYYYFGAAFGANKTNCYRWPALQCDGYSEDPSLYGGANPRLKPGALLAVPLIALPALTAALSTAPARSLAWTLAHFGGLLCDDTYSDRVTFNAEHGFDKLFMSQWGFPFVTWPNDARPGAQAWLNDVLTLWRALKIVDSNAQNTVGGGGTPLAPPPPPFC
jgi:hypothetical protein